MSARLEPPQPQPQPQPQLQPLRLRLLTVNIHKGYNAFNRRNVLHELRDAVRAQGSDLVLLQEVEGHDGHQLARLSQTVQCEVPPDAPLVVAGDFNDWRLRADELLAASGLREVFRGAFGQHARSFPARWPLLRLDRIYVRGVVAARPLPMPRAPLSRLSDHAPLAAEIDLPGAP